MTCGGLLLLAVSSVRANTITVNSTADVAANDGQCTLREAIVAANTNTASGVMAGECTAGAAGPDTIAFAITGASLHTITLASILPQVTEALTIDGYTQPGSSANTLAVGDNALILIEIDGNNLSTGLYFTPTAPNSLVRGLAMRRAAGSALIFDFGDNFTAQGNFLGTNATATATGPGGSYGIFIGAANALVGGTAPAQRNVIAGNSAGINVQFLSPFSLTVPSAVIQGNYLGTNASGSAAILSNYGVVAIAGTGDVLGTVTIGGTAAGSGNLVSGNALNGIRIDLGGSSGTIGAVTIQGNILGLDATGTTAVPNTGDAIAVLRNAAATMGPVLIGGTTAGAGNVVASSTGAGSSGILLNGVTLSTVQGNLIGTDVTGTLARPNGRGINILNGGTALIGGAIAAARNVIAANLGSGISISDANVTIQGNYVGTQIDGVTPLPDGSLEIFVATSTGSTTATVGGIAPGAGNRIVMGSLGTGVAVRGSPNRTTIRGNSIALSAPLGFGISLSSTTEPVFNDACDADTGPNGLQNFPVVTSTVFGPGIVTVAGTLNSTASTTFQIDIYSSPACSAAGYNYGPGRTYLGSTTVTTDAACNGNFNAILPVPPGETVITTTATDPAGNTSEFSQCLSGPAPTATNTPTGTPTPTATPSLTPTPTGTPIVSATMTPTPQAGAGVLVPTLSPLLLALFGVGLALSALFLMRRSG